MPLQFIGSTLRGIPESDTRPDYYIMGNTFFFISLAIEVLIIISLLYSIFFTFYRAVKNIGQPVVEDPHEQENNNNPLGDANELRPEEDVEADLKREDNIMKQLNVKNAYYSKKGDVVDIENEDDIVYNFEDDDPPAKKRNQDPEQAKQNNDDSDESDDQDQEQQQQLSEAQQKIQTQQQITIKQKLFKYQDTLYRFVPATIVPILSINSLTVDFIALGGFMFSALCYVCFNMLELCGTKKPIYKNIYLIGTLATFASFFMNVPTMDR